MRQPMHTQAELIKWAEYELKRSGIKCAGHDAERLFLDVFQRSREDLAFDDGFRPSLKHADLFRRYVALRASRYPLQYILNYTEFYGIPLKLAEGVFIPRPETEILVDRLSEYLRAKGKRDFSVLEIGTGSGNIAISLTKNVTGCKILASDISDKALKTAEDNARANGVNDGIGFIRSDGFDDIPHAYYNYFDVIVSNPPYVRRSELAALEPEISHEDPRALDGGRSGLRFYARILKNGMKFLKKDGVFAFEIGYDQAGRIADIAKKDRRFLEPRIHKDLNGCDRVMMIERRPRARQRKEIG